MLTKERLSELFRYDQDTGYFTVVADVQGRKPGSLSGRKNNHGYVTINVDGKRYQAHRLAWLYVTGNWPKDQLDHINGNRSDNRFENLRPASVAQNAFNQKKPVTNTSGKKGATWHRKTRKWQSHIKFDGRTIYLGLFSTVDEAHAAYADAAKKYHGEFARIE